MAFFNANLYLDSVVLLESFMLSVEELLLGFCAVLSLVVPFVEQLLVVCVVLLFPVLGVTSLIEPLLGLFDDVLSGLFVSFENEQLVAKVIKIIPIAARSLYFVDNFCFI